MKMEILDLLKKGNHQQIRFAFADIDGVLRGKLISTKKFTETLDEGIGFCDVVFGWDAMDKAYDSATFTGWHTGYPDKPVHLDLSTLRFIPWQQGTPFFTGDFKGLPTCPRSLLRRIAGECQQMGFRTQFAQEFEWFNFQETPASLHEKSFVNPRPLSPGMFGYSILRTSNHHEYYQDLFDSLTRFDIPIEGLHTETGPGVYEAAIHHDEILRAADKAALFKTGVREIAYKHGLVASFMAKWNADLPGCSGHIHQSLWSPDGNENLFYAESDPERISNLFRHYIAGQLHCLPEIMPLYAPTINSYKRLVEGAWAPTSVNWGFDNRTTALRVLNNGMKNTRLETRVPGSDSNPYLAMAAALASGLYGIKHKLELPLAPVSGNGYKAEGRKLHGDLLSATQAMRESKLARELFGTEFVDHFTQTRIWECRQFAQAVTDWEMKRYFEII